MRMRPARLLWLVVLLAGGCGGPGGRGVFIPVVEKPADAAWPFVLPTVEAPAKDAKTEGPHIQVSASFIAAQPADLKRLGIDTDKPLSAITGSEHGKALGALLRARRAQLVTNPRLLVAPGQPASVAMTTGHSYVADYEREKVQGAPAATTRVPVVRKFYHGIVLTVRADLEAGQVVLTALTAKMSYFIGTRDCKGEINYAGKEMAWMLWQEPVVLTAEAALPADGKVVLKPGSAVAIPLTQSLRVAQSRARKLLDGEPEVLNPGGVAKLLKGLDERGYRVPGAIVLVVAARPAPGEDAEPPLPKER